MKTQPVIDSEDRLNITGTRNNRTMSSEKGGEKSEVTIPIDLIFEILSRLPVKSIARCRCVSKPWASMLRRPEFTELFLTRSLDLPKLLFGCTEGNELSIFSSFQPENPDENSCRVAANYHMSFLYSDSCYKFSRPTLVHGLMCFECSQGEETKLMVCNPSTGQSLPLPALHLPKVAMMFRVKRIGYDPIEKQYKVLLSMTWQTFQENEFIEEHQILTLRNGNLSWRKIESCTPHKFQHGEICINGVLYYIASYTSSSWTSKIVSFDLRSEKFSFIKSSMETLGSRGTLVNYNGKLGLFACEGNDFVCGASTSIELWVLQDVEKQEWSGHTYVLPALWEKVVGDTCLRLVGVTKTKEMVFSSSWPPVPFYVFYYNTVRNTIVRVEIQGMKASKSTVCVCDHIENVKLMQDICL